MCRKTTWHRVCKLGKEERRWVMKKVKKTVRKAAKRGRIIERPTDRLIEKYILTQDTDETFARCM